jgi:hypothetical protein
MSLVAYTFYHFLSESKHESSNQSPSETPERMAAADVKEHSDADTEYRNSFFFVVQHR